MMIKIFIKDLDTGVKSKPVDIDWLLFGETDLEFENGDTMPLKDFKSFRREYEICPLDESTTANTQSPVIDEIVIAAKELNDACDEMWNTPDIKGKVPDHIVRIITKAQKKLYQIISNQLK